VNQDRRDQKGLQVAGDMSFEQAIGTTVDWDVVADMAVRQGTTHLTKRVLTAASWGVLPTPLWLARHGWETEVVCPECGRSQDLRHTMVGCGKEEAVELVAGRKAFDCPHLKMQRP
jgi:hypothetical protein